MKNIRMIITTLLFAIMMAAFLWGAAQKDKGVGPVKSYKMSALDMNLAKKGKNIFEAKCAVCHQLDGKKIGPPLRYEFSNQTPEFILNLLLNTTEMQQKDEYMKNLIHQYNNILMIDYKLSRDDAKELLEYLRAASEKKL